MRDKGFSARKLQLIMDFPYVQTIYNWFAGKNMPTIDNLVVLAQVLGVTMDELIITQHVKTEISQEDAEELSA
ncbi:MAG: helix-turn-helix transcriptional regulator [Treponema sp.]|nr:helix-turn-helix transcriptional regulator [Treponema sp.]